MQGSYALLMIFYKTRVAKDGSNGLKYDANGSPSTERLVEELRMGLERIVGAISNYSRALEALDGMRGNQLTLILGFSFHSLTIFSDGIEAAIHTAFTQR
jgi:hypothetical protein